MNLETFFEKFDQFADAPYAVAKMRELVLDLAVRGKLVVQNVTDEPAAQLLKRVLAEKNRRTGRNERSDEKAGLLPDNELFEIPVNWEWIGATTPAVMVSDQGKKVQTKNILAAGKYPVVDQGKVFIRGYCDDFDKVIRVAEPMVLFGDHTRETKFIDFDFVVGADGVKLLQPICIDPRFYFLVLRWLPLESRGYARHFKLLKAARIPLPPLAEQKRIVAKVDELMGLCDRLEAQQLERETRQAALARASIARFLDAPTPANLSFLFHSSYAVPTTDLRQTILTLAVRGILVTQEPQGELPREGGNTSSGRWSNHCEMPFNIPRTWTWERLGSIAQIERGGSPRPIQNYFTSDPDGLNWIKIGDAEKGGKYITSTREKIRKEGLTKTRKVFPGDFLLTNSMSFGRPYITKIEGCIHDGWLRIHPPNSIAPDYLYHLLSSPYVFEFFSRAAAGGVVQNLNADKVRDLIIPLPPFAEQLHIVAKVEQLLALVDRLETQIGDAHSTAEKLLEAIVAEIVTEPKRAA